MVGGRVVILVLLLVAASTALPATPRTQALSLSATPFLAKKMPVDLRGRSSGARRGQLVELRGGDGGADAGVDKPVDVAALVHATHQVEEPKWQPSPASERHDTVNLFVLFFLGAGALAGMILNKAWLHTGLTYAGFIYILLDSLWMVLQPSIVKSPGMVVGHHIATLMVLADPLSEPRHRVYTSACLLVEINTLLLLLRRRLSYHAWVEWPFIITWIALRNIWYPMLMLYFFLCVAPTIVTPLLPASLTWVAEMRNNLEGGDPTPMLKICMLSWTAVCLFQFRWTVQLFGAHPWIWGKKSGSGAGGPPSPPNSVKSAQKNFL
mmetsp:Transcript_2150/g.5146  ORF Transcript_2150/g.5146 Transcript_2150/m.5146 type:complete len:323 (-) Transcript_2150:38-1006(-)